MIIELCERILRPDTRLTQLRADGQGPFFRSLDHLGRSGDVKKFNIRACDKDDRDNLG